MRGAKCEKTTGQSAAERDAISDVIPSAEAFTGRAGCKTLHGLGRRAKNRSRRWFSVRRITWNRLEILEQANARRMTSSI